MQHLKAKMKKNKNKKTNNTPKEPKTNPSEIVVEGTVETAFANAMFDVLLDNGNIARCSICGKMRQKKIRINPGDRVQLGLSIYDLAKGRILYRLKDVKNDNSTV